MKHQNLSYEIKVFQEVYTECKDSVSKLNSILRMCEDVLANAITFNKLWPKITIEEYLIILDELNDMKKHIDNFLKKRGYRA